MNNEYKSSFWARGPKRLMENEIKLLLMEKIMAQTDLNPRKAYDQNDLNKI